MDQTEELGSATQAFDTAQSSPDWHSLRSQFLNAEMNRYITPRGSEFYSYVIRHPSVRVCDDIQALWRQKLVKNFSRVFGERRVEANGKVTYEMSGYSHVEYELTDDGQAILELMRDNELWRKIQTRIADDPGHSMTSDALLKLLKVESKAP